MDPSGTSSRNLMVVLEHPPAYMKIEAKLSDTMKEVYDAVVEELSLQDSLIPKLNNLCLMKCSQRGLNPEWVTAVIKSVDRFRDLELLPNDTVASQFPPDPEEENNSVHIIGLRDKVGGDSCIDLLQLERIGYSALHRSLENKHIAYGLSPQIHSRTVFKFISHARSRELQILERLHRDPQAIEQGYLLPYTVVLRTDEHAIISMPKLECLAEGKKHSFHETSTFCRKLVKAVGYLHQKKIAHRDIKVSNIVVDASSPSGPQLYLIDFDCASVVKNGREETDWKPVGTHNWVAPEVKDTWDLDSDDEEEERHGKGYSIIAADIWAVGFCFFWILNHYVGKFKATELQTEWDLGELLRHYDPRQRPAMEEALAILDASKSQTSSPSSTLVPDSKNCAVQA